MVTKSVKNHVLLISKTTNHDKIAWSRSWSLPTVVLAGVQFLPVVLPQAFPVILPSCHFVCLYTISHLLLEEFRISLKSFFTTQSSYHTISPRVGVKIWFWAESEGRNPES